MDTSELPHEPLLPPGHLPSLKLSLPPTLLPCGPLRIGQVREAKPELDQSRMWPAGFLRSQASRAPKLRLKSTATTRELLAFPELVEPFFSSDSCSFLSCSSSAIVFSSFCFKFQISP